MSGVKGDFGALHKLELKLGGLVNGDFMQTLKKELGQESLKLLADEFKGGFDPWGKKWQPLKRKRRRKKAKKTDTPLNDSGRLRNSFTYSTTGNGFEVGTNVVYAAIHQYGGRIARNPRTFQLHFNTEGRFMSARAAARRKKPPKTITVRTKLYFIDIPARPFIPEGGPGRWEIPFLKVTKREMDKLLDSKSLES